MSEPSDDEIPAPAGVGASARRRRRWFVDFETTFVSADGAVVPCTVYDLSSRGAGVGVAERHAFKTGDRVEFELPGHGGIVAEVRYRGRGYLGLEFLFESEDEEETEVARHLVTLERGPRAEGREVKLSGKLRAAGVDIDCTVLDLSRNGARVMLQETRHLGDGQEVTLEVRGLGAVAARVADIDHREIGLAFLERLDADPGERIAGTAS